jgi:hypothetical protein
MTLWDVPRFLVTCKLRSYGVIVRYLCPSVENRSHKGLNNRSEASHRHTRRRKNTMARFNSPHQAQRFLSVHDQTATAFLRHHTTNIGLTRSASGPIALPKWWRDRPTTRTLEFTVNNLAIPDDWVGQFSVTISRSRDLFDSCHPPGLSSKRRSPVSAVCRRSQYRVCRRSPVRWSAPISTKPCRSRVVVARDVPVMAM